MKWYYLLTTLNIVAAFLPFVFGALRLRYMDTAAYIFWVLTGTMAIGECVAYYYAKRYHNNMPVYTVMSWIETLLVALYFNYSVSTLRKRKAGIYIGILAVAAGILNAIYLQPLKVVDSYFLVLEATLTIAIAMYSLVQLYLADVVTRLTATPHFWLAIILTLFWTLSMMQWVLYDSFTEILPRLKWLIDLSILLVSILTNLAIAMVFFQLPKMKLSYER